MISRLFLILFVLFGPFLSYASSEDCVEKSWTKVEYSSPKRGSVNVYLVPSMGNVSVTNLACVLGAFFLANKNDLPNKATVGFITEDALHARLAQWSLPGNYLMLGQVDLNGDEAGHGEFLLYEGALDRIREVLTHQKLPTSKKKFFKASRKDLLRILENK